MYKKKECFKIKAEKQNTSHLLEISFTSIYERKKFEEYENTTKATIKIPVDKCLSSNANC